MIASFLAVACSVLLVGLLLLIEAKRLILSKRFKHIPGVPEVPFAGSPYTFRTNELKDIGIIFNTIISDKITKLFIGPKVIFFVSDPDVLQTILNGNNFTERPFFFDFFRLPFGIITSKFHEWKPVRKSLNPAFSQRMSLSFIPTFEKHFNRFCKDIQQQGGNTFNFSEMSVKNGIQIILETNFGFEDTENTFSGHIFEKYEENICLRIATPSLYPDFTYNRSKLGKEDQQIDATIKRQFRELIRKRELQQIDRDQSQVNGGRLFVDEMLKHVQEKKYETDDVLIQNMITIFMAGYETAALTLSYTILLLAMHPEIDAKVAAELQEHYDVGQPIDQELLRKLTYLDMVIREAMRLFPPAPITARQNFEPTHIDKIGQVEKGSIMVLSFYNLHRWKEIWGEDANEFNPEHFSPENSAKRHPYAFLPFSGGAKVCLGYQYAMINVKVGLVKLLSQFRFSTELKMSDFEYKFSVTLKLVNESIVKAHPRDSLNKL